MAYPILAPKDTWYTQGGTSIKRSTITEIDIKDTYTPAGAVTAHWDGSAAKDGSITVYVEGTKLTIAGNGSGKIQANADSSAVFSDTAGKDRFLNLTGILADDFYTGEVTTFQNAFRVNKLTNIDFVKKWDFKKCQNMQTMFRESNGIASINLPGLSFPEANNIFAMFQRSSCATVNISGWNLPKVIKAGYVFGWCPNLEFANINNLRMPVAETLSHFFSNDTALTAVDMNGLYAPAMLNYGAMFNDCSSLETVDVSMLSAEAKAFSQMFERCSKIKHIKGLTKLNTRNATSYVDKPIDSQVALAEMFSGCVNIEELDLSSFDTRRARVDANNGMTNMMANMPKLKKVILGQNFDWTGGFPKYPPTEQNAPVLPTPNPTYIPGADGKWYDLSGKAYTPAEAIKIVPNTYFASKELARSEPVMMQNGTLIDIGEAIRTRRADAVYRKPNEMAAAIESIV